MSPQWISVKDRMPEEEKPTIRYGYAYSASVLTYTENGLIRINRTREGHWEDYTPRVTHWMPLPVPPGDPQEQP